MKYLLLLFKLANELIRKNRELFLNFLQAQSDHRAKN